MKIISYLEALVTLACLGTATMYLFSGQMALCVEWVQAGFLAHIAYLISQPQDGVTDLRD